MNNGQNFCGSELTKKSATLYIGDEVGVLFHFSFIHPQLTKKWKF
jgi:hypothetical protein